MKRNLSILYIFSFILCLFTSCENEEKNKPLAIIHTLTVSRITETTALCGGNITDNKGSIISKRGVCWSTTHTPTIKNFKTEDSGGDGNYTSLLTELQPNTTYFVRAYAINEGGVAYGLQETFTTSAGYKCSISLIDISSYSARVKIFNSESGIPYTKKGICYSTSKNPTTDDHTILSTEYFNIFLINIPELKSNTTYYARSFITTNYTTYYSEQIIIPTQMGSSNTAAPMPGIQYANCYLICPNDEAIKIPVDIANFALAGSIGLDDKLTAELIWSETPNPLTVNSCIRKIAIEGTGSSAKLVVTPGGVEGNAVVAVKANEIIKWSWHIWVADYDPKVAAKPLLLNAIAMDRNLGALSSTKECLDKNRGLLYQWGRKDPFTSWTSTTENHERILYTTTGITMIDFSETTQNLYTTSIANPTTILLKWGPYTAANDSLWMARGNQKSVLDPCPPGWKLPQTTEFATYSSAAASSNSYGTVYKDLWFPEAGYRNDRYIGQSGSFYFCKNRRNKSYAEYIDISNGVRIWSSENAFDSHAHSIRCIRDH